MRGVFRGRLQGSQPVSECWIEPTFPDPAFPWPTPRPTMALWDTGASLSAISPSLARDCQLLQVGTVDVTPAGSRSSRSFPRHVINITIPGLRPFYIVRTAEVELPDSHQLIIGMDIISQGEFRLRPRRDDSLEITFRDLRASSRRPFMSLFRR